MPKKVKQGTVVSDKMEKAIVVQVAEKKAHKKYKKIQKIDINNFKEQINILQNSQSLNIVENKGDYIIINK